MKDWIGIFIEWLARIAAVIIIGLIIYSLLGCKTVERIVTVPEVHHEYHYQRDSIIQRDTITNNSTTIVRQVDSATMARYGIQLANSEQAWLVQTDLLRREVSELRQQKADTVLLRDSVGVPYPVEVQVRKPPNWYEWALMWVGTLTLISGGVFLFIKLRK